MGRGTLSGAAIPANPSFWSLVPSLDNPAHRDPSPGQQPHPLISAPLMTLSVPCPKARLLSFWSPIPCNTTSDPLCSTLPSLLRSLQSRGFRPRQGLHVHWLIPHWQCLNPLQGSLPRTWTSPRFQVLKPQALTQPSQPGLRDTPLPYVLSLSASPSLTILPSVLSQHSSSFPGCSWAALSPPCTVLRGRAHLSAGFDHCVLLGTSLSCGSRQDAGVEVPLDLPFHCSTSNHGAILGPLPLFPHPTGNQAQALLRQASTASPTSRSFTTVCLPRFSPSNLPSTPQPG